MQHGLIFASANLQTIRRHVVLLPRATSLGVLDSSGRGPEMGADGSTGVVEHLLGSIQIGRHLSMPPNGTYGSELTVINQRQGDSNLAWCSLADAVGRSEEQLSRRYAKQVPRNEPSIVYSGPTP